MLHLNIYFEFRLNPSRGDSGFTIWGPGNSKLNFVRNQEVRTKREGSDLSFKDIFSSAVNLEPKSAESKLKTQYLNPFQLPTTLKSQFKSKNKPGMSNTLKFMLDLLNQKTNPKPLFKFP